ncbi:hypothetical protein Pint_09143 [Pistacia integerrima]|nr:hypothetical protein Pint_09143 [Pistacia integerrima]KAJ0086226.1 hypothetical protein Patl1_09306 [Pistacia atlantica]
MEKVGE